MADLYRYASCNKGGIRWTKEEIRDLVDKGYLIDPHYKKNDTFPDSLEVTDKFIEKIFASEDRFQQVYKAFPTLIDNFKNPRGPKIKLKVCDIDKMKDLYETKVKSKILHKKIMEAIEWGKENDAINFNFENFIRGHLWEALFEEMEQHVDGEGSNMHIAQ